MLLPKKITPNSKIRLVQTSSPVEKNDMRTMSIALRKIRDRYRYTKFFDVEHNELDPRYLSGSERARLRKFKIAMKDANWLAPIYGGTGCADIVRHLKDNDLMVFRRERPVVNGFSDTTFLLNYLYFELKLLTFHYSNTCGLFEHDNYQLFLDIIEGTKNKFSFFEKNYEWLGPSGAPTAPIEGVAIGGNISTFRDLLDMYNIRLRTWDDYILFVEDIEVDIEDLHRVVIALDQRGVFKNIKALVIGRFDEKGIAGEFNKLNRIFGGKKKSGEERPEWIFQYLLSFILKKRLKTRDPLYILAVDNLGHGVQKNTMIVPIGGNTVIHPDKKIEFIGPFVK